MLFSKSQIQTLKVIDSMGRTLPPFRPALEMELETWKEFRRGLRQEDRPIFDELTDDARKHADAGSLAGRPLLTEVIFFSIAIEQQKRIKNLESKMVDLVNRIVQLEKEKLGDIQ